MELDNIETPEDILEFMNEKIEYGWVDIDRNRHVRTMKDFRKMYRTMFIDEILNTGLGTCIDQVNLMHYLFDKINVKNKMYCCRIFEPDEYNNLEEEEHMHCFLLYFLDGKVFHIEHPNFEKIGIYEYESEEKAISSIVNYYVKLRGGAPSPTKEFFEVQENISFREFNKYINNLNTKEFN